MKIASIALAVALTGLASSAIATADDPESAFVLDLTPAGAHSYHIHCEHNAKLSECRSPSLWENTNGLRGLQTRNTPTANGMIPLDSELLG